MITFYENKNAKLIRTSLTMIELSCIYLVDSGQQLLKQILRKSSVLNRLWTGHTF